MANKHYLIIATKCNTGSNLNFYLSLFNVVYNLFNNILLLYSILLEEIYTNSKILTHGCSIYGVSENFRVFFFRFYFLNYNLKIAKMLYTHPSISFEINIRAQRKFSKIKIFGFRLTISFFRKNC